MKTQSHDKMGRRSEETFPPRYSDGQQVHKNANRHHLIPVRIAVIKKARY